MSLKKEFNIGTWINNNPYKAVIAVAVLVRLLLAYLYQHITIYPDTQDYVDLARRLLSLDLNQYEGQRTPGYPFLLSITGVSYFCIVAIQCSLGVCSLLLFYKTMLLVGLNKRIAVYASLFMACYLPMAFFEFSILSESLTLCVVSAIFFLFFMAMDDKKNKINIVFYLSALCGFLVLIKPFYVFLPALLFLFFVVKKGGMKSAKRHLLIFIFPLSLFGGWSYLNKINTGQFTSTTFFGYNLAQNCVSFAEKTTPEYQQIGDIYAKQRDKNMPDKEIAMTIWMAYPELQEATASSFTQLSAKLYDYSIATIKNNPVAYIKQVFVSWRDFWKTSLYYEYESFTIPEAAPITKYICLIERGLLQLMKLLFVLLIPYNMVLFFRRKELSLPLIISIVVFTASVLQALVTYGTNSRFSFPFELLVLLSVLINCTQFWNIRFAKKITV